MLGYEAKPISATATYDIFISYANADRAWVEGYLLDALVQAGIRCHSESAFELGRPRLLEFERAVQQSRWTLLVLSPAYLSESWNDYVRLLAQTYGIETASWPVIPLILHPVDLPLDLKMLVALDATDAQRREECIERLCRTLHMGGMACGGYYTFKTIHTTVKHGTPQNILARHAVARLSNFIS